MSLVSQGVSDSQGTQKARGGRERNERPSPGWGQSRNERPNLDRDFDHNRHPRSFGSGLCSQPVEITRAVKGESALLMNEFDAQMKRPAATGLFQEREYQATTG